MIMTEHRTSLRFADHHQPPGASNLSFASPFYNLQQQARSRDSRSRRSRQSAKLPTVLPPPPAPSTLDTLDAIIAATPATVGAGILGGTESLRVNKPTASSNCCSHPTGARPGEARARLYGELSTSAPNLRRLLELERQHRPVAVIAVTPPRTLKHGLLNIQPFGGADPLSPPQTSSSPTRLSRQNTTTTTSNGSGSGTSNGTSMVVKLQAVNRAIVRSRHMPLRNSCDLESQTEERLRADLLAYRKRSMELTRAVHEHLKAENRPTKGLFYEMIFSKRLDKSRQSIRDNQFGLVDALASESESESLLQGNKEVLKEPAAAAAVMRFETPTRIALSIAKQLDPDRAVQIGVNGRMFTTSSPTRSPGWSSTHSSPVSQSGSNNNNNNNDSNTAATTTTTQNSNNRPKKKVEIRL